MDISAIGDFSSIAGTIKSNETEDKSKAFEQSLQKAMAGQDDKALQEACKEMEAYMLSSLFKQMKASTQLGESLIEKGQYEEMFEDQLIDEQCKEMVKAGGIGLAASMYKQMSKI